jgi:beta-lactamase regulating signal transducer with metallopeptidase domain
MLTDFNLQSTLANVEPYMNSAFHFLALNSFYSALIVIVILVTKLLFPKMPRGIEYGLWCLALIRLILPTEFSISYSLGYLSHSWVSSELPSVIASTSWLTDKANQSFIFSLSYYHFLMLFWATSSSLITIKLVSLKIKLARILAQAHPIEESWVTEKVNFWRREFKVQRGVIVISSNDFLSPFTFGMLTPVIFIPKQILNKKSDAMMTSIISHELSHIKRLDAAWLLFQNVIQIIYCLNPLLWLAVRRLNFLREELCDQKVLNSGKVTSEEYGRCLLDVLKINLWGENSSRSPELFATFFLSHQSVFKKRISAIINNKKLKVKSVYQYASVALFALFFLPMNWQKVIEKKPVISIDTEELNSPFPEGIREGYKAPILAKPNDTPY